ncbi:hypothetical protein L1049_012596 [Liquidambar formosana]|uniref:RanBP2-type domain-containing protein n=1 Tax=Liquidambar formosana TaxID=63359 RepID=A0AAP0QY27_LIQFO
MAFPPFSLLLRRRVSSQNPNPYLSHLLFSHILKPFSTSQTNPNPNPTDPKPSNLSARLSFVFDQIDAIERERSQKDETLQRIRAWRESKNQKKNAEDEASKSKLGNWGDSAQLNKGNGIELGLGRAESDSGELTQKEVGLLKKEVELVHPWPEWIELMERLFQQNYFDHRRKDEDKMVQDLGFDMSDVVEEGFDFTRDWKTVQTACLNFGKDRFDILRSLSRQDIQILVGYGCPSVDKKVVFSAKLLRKHVHLDEGDVCSSCSLRSSCERGFLLTNKEDEARTIDVMRVLLAFGFDPVNGSDINKSLLKQKSVKTVVRKLLHEVVKLSAVPIDPNLSPPVFKKPPPKVKQPPPPPKRRVGRDDIEMKKGDWLCPKCDFMNFAKNTVCLQCDAKRPKRQLLPGEWECPECNFLNYRRNMACFHCDHKRPPDEFMENQMQERQRGPRTRLEKVASRPEASNAWNFDFDDNESDGADVAAFEYADSPRMGEDSPLDSRAQGGNFKGSEDDFNKASRIPSAHEREYSDLESNRPRMGFDDFDDEEDDVDSYEIDTRNDIPVRKPSSNDFLENEGFSESEDMESSSNNLLARRRAGSSLYNNPPKPMHRKAAFSGSEDDELDFGSDEELSVHPNWKSSHVANSRQSKGRGGTSPSRGLSFGSDEEPGLSSGTEDDLEEDFGSRRSKGGKWGSNRREFRGRERSDIEHDSFYGSDSGDDNLRSPRNRLRGNKAGPSGGGNNFKSLGRDSRHRSNSMMGDRRNSFNDNFDRSSQGSRGNNRGFQGDDYGGRRSNGMMGDRRNSFNNCFDRSSRGGRGNERGFRGDDNGGRRMNNRGGRGEGFRNRQHGRFNEHDDRLDMNRDFDNERPRRQRIIER